MAAKYKKRADGRYLIQIQVGIQDNGKPTLKNIYGRTIREVEEKAATFRQELERGIVVNDQNLTLAVWASKWLELYKSGKEFNTIQMYKHVINVHIIPELGHLKLKEIKHHHIQELINKKAGEGLTRTVENIKLTLNQIMQQALENEFIYKNPVSRIQLPNFEKPKKRALTDQEKDLIYKANLDLKTKAFVMTLLYTGLRRGEALALTKSDIDLKNNLITVNKSAIFKNSKPDIKNTPKTEAGNRRIPILSELQPILKQYLPTVDSLYVFPNTKGALMSKNSMTWLWRKFIDELNVSAGGKDEIIIKSDGSKEEIKMWAIRQDITPHIFRHTYATTLYYAGVDIKTSQYLLGHSSIHMTMDIYTHLDAENNIDAATKLNLYISSKAQKKDSKTNNW